MHDAPPPAARLVRRIAIFVTFIGALAGAAPPAVLASTYEVRACDAAPGFVNNSWSPEVTHGGMAVYPVCPSEGADNGGLVARHVAQPSGWTVPSGAAGRWWFWAPPGAAVVGIRANATFDQWDHRWQVGLSNGSTLLAGCWATPTDTGGVCGDLKGEGEYISTPPVQAIYTEVFCVYGPCPAYYTSSAPGNVFARAVLRSAIVTVADDTTPALGDPTGDVWTDAWISGRRSVSFNATDNTGIKTLRLLVDDQVKNEQVRTCDVTVTMCPDGGGALSVLTSDGIADGRHTLKLQAIDRADNISELTRSINTDNTAPSAPTQLAVVGGEGWRSANSFKITWTNPPQPGTAPISGAEYKLCPAAARPTDCVSARKDGDGLKELGDVKVAKPGDVALSVWLHDAAGNADEKTAGPPVHLRFDPDAPEVALLPPDPADPARVRAKAVDATSGLAGGEIELRRRGEDAWRPLGARLDGGGLTAVLDDEHLPDGTYDLRARAADQAGNERSSDTFDGGQPAEITLPVRIKTRLAVGKVKRVRARRARNGKRRYRRVLIYKPTTRYGRTTTLHGRLTTPGANPLAGVEVEVYEQLALPGAESRHIATITTSRTGRFAFKALRGPSRTLLFRYPGTSTIRARTSEVELRVKAASTLRVSRRSVVNGEFVTFRGRLIGGPLPPEGKLVALQVYARRRWRTFATPRAWPNTGRWALRYRFDGTRSTVRYRFRAKIPRESNYPYITGTSRRVRVTVHGL